MADTETVNVRYLVDDVAASVDFYTRHFGFTVGISSPAFADVTRGNLRLLLSGPQSSAGRAMTDGERPGPGGWNRIHLIVDDLDAEIARLTDGGRAVPQRGRDRSRRRAGPRRRPLGQLRRAVPTGRAVSITGGPTLPRGHMPDAHGRLHRPRGFTLELR